MKERSKIILKGLLAKNHEGSSLLQFLSEKEGFEKIETPEKIDFAELITIQHSLRQLHYTWFVAPLNRLPETSRGLFFFLFDVETKEKLKELIPSVQDRSPEAPLARNYLCHFLKESLFPRDVLPLSLLPPSPLNELLHLPKEGLLHIIDLLGIHDLAAELKHVVDNTLLTKIHQSLSQTQTQFLHYAMKQPMKWIPPKMNLERMEIDKKNMNALLHKRGLFRLAMGTTHEVYSFKWHLMHHLDIGRGEYLSKLFAGKEDPAMITYFRGQIVHLLQRISFKGKE